MPDSKTLSKGAKLALMKLAAKDPMLPSDDMMGACGPYGKVLERHGFAVPAGRCMGYKTWVATPTGKTEGLKLSRQSAVKP